MELTCTNRDLPASLTYGIRGGDLFLEGGSSVRSIGFLRKPTASHRFERGRGAHWRLISHLSLNHLSLPGNPFACLVRGIEVRLTIEEEAFVGSGIHAFAHLIERFLGLYVHANSFTQLVVVSKKSGEELLRCTPRSGDLKLV